MAREYPLDWPCGQPRKHQERRREARFRLSFPEAWDLLCSELERLRVGNLVVSTNAVPRDDDFPVVRKGMDPGVAVYFDRYGQSYVIACDSYRELRHNVQAIAVTVKSFRDIERHGASEMLETAIGGFRALPAASTIPAEVPQAAASSTIVTGTIVGELPWYEVLGVSVDASEGEVRAAFERVVASNPDFVKIARARMLAESAVAQRSHVEMTIGVNSRIG